MKSIKLLIVLVLSLFVFSTMANSSPPQEHKQYSQFTTVSCDTLSTIDVTVDVVADTVSYGSFNLVRYRNISDARFNPVLLGHDTLLYRVSLNYTLYISPLLLEKPIDLHIRDGDNSALRIS